MNKPAKDTRIVYGAMCVWWDSIDSVATNSAGLPCCPHCNGLLMEVDSPDKWWAGVDRHAIKEPGYHGFISWLRGKCFKTIGEARQVYDTRKRGEP